MVQLIRPGIPVLFGGAPAEFHMREATAPMLGVEALRLDVAYAAIGQRLGVPTQAYMALSDSRELDAQAGAESFGSALLAGLAGIDSVSGPGMLDYVMTFSLAKLVFDNEVCGQVKRLLRPIEPLDDLPTCELMSAQLATGHLLTAPHTLAHWPDQLYMPGPVWDRKSHDNRARSGSPSLEERAAAEVEARLAAYRPVTNDPRLEVELRRLIEAGGTGDTPLPCIEPAQPAAAQTTDRRPHNRRPRRGS
jgi:trimethylamine--corrinoid protein Co-methyltransferase